MADSGGGDVLETARYLHRIAYHGRREPTAQTLKELHLAHLLSVPFENLDIHLGRPIRLDEAALFSKIVQHRRGGFCYELNSLFAALLRHLGFSVTLLSAEVAHQAGGFSPPFDHLALLVTLEEPWLVDVGFGESFREPLRLEARQEQVQPGGRYRLEQEGAYWTVWAWTEGSWAAQYRFTLQPYGMEDFASRCHYHQTSPESHFTQQRLCTCATPEGRVTLSELRLITTRGKERQEQLLSAEEEYRRVLQDQFGVIL